MEEALTSVALCHIILIGRLWIVFVQARYRKATDTEEVEAIVQ